jgi:hypothetical protein
MNEKSSAMINRQSRLNLLAKGFTEMPIHER